MDHLPKVDRGSQSILVRETTFLCSCFPILFTDKILECVLQISRNTKQLLNYKLRFKIFFNYPHFCFFSSLVNQISGGVTIVKVGGNQSPTNSNITRTTQTDNNGRNSRFIFILLFIYSIKKHLLNIHILGIVQTV